MLDELSLSADGTDKLCALFLRYLRLRVMGFIVCMVLPNLGFKMNRFSMLTNGVLASADEFVLLVKSHFLKMDSSLVGTVGAC